MSKIEIDPDARREGQLKLNDLVSSVEYIPLETNDSCVTGQIYTYDVTPNYILVLCSKSTAVYLFDRSGRFIARVGRKGQGLGEYNYIDNIFVDEKLQRIFIRTYDPNRLNMYGFNGEYISHLPLDEYGKPAGSIKALFDNKYLVIYRNSMGKKDYTYEIRDRDYKLLGRGVRSVPYSVYGTPDGRSEGANVVLGWFDSYYRFENKIYVKENALNDTVYSITGENTFHPEYLLGAGKYGITVDIRSDFTGAFDRMNQCVELMEIYETADCVLISYEYQSKKYRCYYDKQSGDLFYFPSKDGIPNDYDSGMDFWPEKQENDRFYKFYEAHLIREQLLNTASNGKDHAAAVKFRDFANRLKEDDNPLLVVASLKKKTG
ncbi:MAG: 6-bladed beta-propeller [Tannerella sp.]|nr:6-bladed beta-propeller [Tannerella sp.]